MKRLSSRRAPLAVGLGAAGVGLGLGYALTTRRRRARAFGSALEPAIDAPREELFTATSGRVTYYADRRGDGRPILLVHSINAAASAYEVRPFFSHWRGTRPVFAVDLPGFGLSDRKDHVYSPALYTFAIMYMIEAVTAGLRWSSADVVALSLSGEFAARAARDRPDLFHSLTLVSPTGLAPHAVTTGKRALLDRIVDAPVVGPAVFDLLVSRAGIDHFLAKSFAGPVDRGLADYAWKTAHRPGARHAPMAFLHGELFTPHVAELVYEKVHVPTLVLYDEDPYADSRAEFAKLPTLLASAPSWRAERLSPSRGLPQFDMPDETFRCIDSFWADLRSRATELLQA